MLDIFDIEVIAVINRSVHPTIYSDTIIYQYYYF